MAGLPTLPFRLPLLLPIRFVYHIPHSPLAIIIAKCYLCSLVWCSTSGKNARNGRRGSCRSPLDMAVDAKHTRLAEWLRAEGCEPAQGPLSEIRLKSWQAQGWKGDHVPSRDWSTSWGQNSWGKKWADWSGHEPTAGGHEPTTRGHEAKAGDWAGGGEGGSTGSGHGQPASSSGGSGPVPEAVPVPFSRESVRTPSREPSRNKIGPAPRSLKESFEDADA